MVTASPAIRTNLLTSSDLDLTDLFCGGGGSALGAHRVGLRVRLALNHNPNAVRTHSANFPNTHHVCADISRTAPSRFARTAILWASPSCARHSTAAGSLRRKQQQRERDLVSMDAVALDTDLSDAEASRALMLDVIRWLEVHRNPMAVVENVCDVQRWELFPSWWRMLHDLGYDAVACSLNSQIAGTPQDRDRVFIVAWRKGHPAPDLDIRPMAPCAQCATDVHAVQWWKDAPRRRAAATGLPMIGLYGPQYVYRCPTCAHEVLPYFTASGVAIDHTIDAPFLDTPRDGRAVSDTVRRRIQRGLDTFGATHLAVTNNCTTDGGRVRRLTDPFFTLTTSPTHGIAFPDASVLGELPSSAFRAPMDASRTSGEGGRRARWAREAPGVRVPLEAMRYRTLTVRERARLMGFPDDYVFHGTPGEQHRAIGNSVDPAVSELILSRVAATFGHHHAFVPQFGRLAPALAPRQQVA